MRCIERLGWTLAAGGLLLLGGCAAAPRLAAVPEKYRIAEPAVRLDAPLRVKSMLEVRAQAALRLVEANPNGTYVEAPPETLLAIPVLDIELNGNGSIRQIKVLRYPGQAPETTRMAIDAVHRAAPFGQVAHLPKPWKFAETFLFRDDRRFKPRTLDN